MAYIDAHVHFWKYNKQRDTWMNDMKILQQDYLPPALESTLKRNGMNGCVAVQADQSEVETRFLCELAKTWPFIKGVVGWTDLKADDLEQKLEELQAYPEIKGYRHVVQAEPTDFLLDGRFQQGVKKLKSFGYTYDILVYHHQLQAVVKFVDALHQPMVIDHCAKPDLRNKELVNWTAYMKAIAQQPDIYCKLSGLFTEAHWKDWSAGDFYPYLDVVFEAFGVDRLMFGSDWPVILVSGMYVQWKSLLEKYMENFEAEDRDKVFGGNAVRFYGLQV